MASSGLITSSESYPGRSDMIILEATPQLPGIGEAVPTGKSLPVDIPTNIAPTVCQVWAEIAQKSMNEMAMLMSLSRSRSHQSAFSVTSRGRAVSVSTLEEGTSDASHNPSSSWQQEQQHSQPQPQLRHKQGRRTSDVPRVLRFPENFQPAYTDASTTGSNHARARHGFDDNGQAEREGGGMDANSGGDTSHDAVIPPDLDLCWIPGGGRTDELRPVDGVEDDYERIGYGTGGSIGMDSSPVWNRYDAFSPPATRASVISSGGYGGGLSARAVSRSGSSGGGEASMRPASGSSPSYHGGVPASAEDAASPPYSFASEGVFRVVNGTRGEWEEDDGASGFAAGAWRWRRFGVRGDGSDNSEGQGEEEHAPDSDDDDDTDADADADGAVFELDFD